MSTASVFLLANRSGRTVLMYTTYILLRTETVMTRDELYMIIIDQGGNFAEAMKPVHQQQSVDLETLWMRL